MKTIEIPRRKFMVNTCPNSAADAMPVKIVATVDEYFFKIVSEKNIQKWRQLNDFIHENNLTEKVFAHAKSKISTKHCNI